MILLSWIQNSNNPHTILPKGQFRIYHCPKILVDMYTVNSLIFDDCTLRDWGLISEIYHHILCLGQSLQTLTDWILSKCQYDLVLTSSLHAEYEVRVRTQRRLIEHHSKSVKWPFTLTPSVLSKNTLSSPTQLKTLSTLWQIVGLIILKAEENS